MLIDADMQNDPSDIPMMLDKIDEGYDVVSGWRIDRKDPFLTRRLPSRVANWLISRVTGVALHDYGCTLKAYRRDVLQGFRALRGNASFHPGLRWIGGSPHCGGAGQASSPPAWETELRIGTDGQGGARPVRHEILDQLCPYANLSLWGPRTDFNYSKCRVSVILVHPKTIGGYLGSGLTFIFDQHHARDPWLYMLPDGIYRGIAGAKPTMRSQAKPTYSIRQVINGKGGPADI